MKKRIVMLLPVCMALMAAGCGNTENSKDAAGTGAALESTEAGSGTANETGSGTASADIPYDAEGTEAVLEGTETGSGTASVDIQYDAEDYVELGAYIGMEIELNESDYAVTDDSVNDYVDQMITYTKPYLPDESKTEVGENDVADVDYTGKKDGEAFEGGSAENQYIDVAGNKNAQTRTGYIEGFTDGLVGAKVGETVDCEVTFPEDYSSEELKGQTVTFSFTVNAVCTKVEREEIDDAFVKEYLQADSVEALYADARTAIEEEAQSKKESDIRAAVLKKLPEICTVDSYPEGLLERRMDEYVQSFLEYYGSGGMSLGEIVEQGAGMTEEEFLEEVRTYQENNLKQELILEAIAVKENIAFDPDAFETYISNIAASGGYESAEALYESLGSDAKTGERYFRRIYLANMACDKIAEQVKIVYVEPEEGTEALDETAGTENGTEE